MQALDSCSASSLQQLVSVPMCAANKTDSGLDMGSCVMAESTMREVPVSEPAVASPRNPHLQECS